MQVKSFSMLADKELILLSREGLFDAFDELVNRYRRKVWGTAFKMVGNREDAEDVLSETFFAVFKSLSSFREGASFSTYLYRITVNQSINFLRKKKGRDVLPLEGLQIKSNLKSPEEVVLTNELQKALKSALLELKESLREVFILYEIENLSLHKIAEITKESVSCVKSRLHRARLSLREKIAPYLRA